MQLGCDHERGPNITAKDAAIFDLQGFGIRNCRIAHHITLYWGKIINQNCSLRISAKRMRLVWRFFVNGDIDNWGDIFTMGNFALITPKENCILAYCCKSLTLIYTWTLLLNNIENDDLFMCKCASFHWILLRFFIIILHICIVKTVKIKEIVSGQSDPNKSKRKEKNITCYNDELPPSIPW